MNDNRRCKGFYEEPRTCIGSLRQNPTETSIECDQCGASHPRVFTVEPPFSFDFMCKPTGNPKFCPKHNVGSTKGNLTDYSVVECNAGRQTINPYLSATKASGIPDKYVCSYCHKVFEAKCIHSIF